MPECPNGKNVVPPDPHTAEELKLCQSLHKDQDRDNIEALNGTITTEEDSLKCPNQNKSQQYPR